MRLLKSLNLSVYKACSYSTEPLPTEILSELHSPL